MYIEGIIFTPCPKVFMVTLVIEYINSSLSVISSQSAQFRFSFLINVH